MANLIVEDGTGLASANSYINLGFADAYHRDRLNTRWRTDDASAIVPGATRSSAILVATEYIDAMFVFLGCQTHPETPQALAWPRAGIFTEENLLVDQDSLPVALQRATAEMALAVLELGGALPTQTVGGVTQRRERVGVLESELRYDADETTQFYPRVHLLLAPYVAGKRFGGGNAPLLRASAVGAISQTIKANCTITLIERPIRTGVGGDFTLTTIIDSAVPAIREPFNAFALAGNILGRDRDSAGIIADNTFWIDLTDPGATAFRTVAAGDLVTWASTRSALGAPSSDTSRDEVMRVNIFEALGLIREHVEIFTRGQGAP